MDEPVGPSSGSERFFELSSELLCIGSLDGRFLEVNSAWTRALGWTADELTSFTYIDLVHPDDLAATIEGAEDLLQGVTYPSFENRYRHKDGSYRWLRWDSSVQPDTNRVYSVVRDITEERRREAYNEELEHVSGIGTWDVDVATGRMAWSPGTHAIHGTVADRYETNLEDALRFFPVEGRRELEPALMRLLTTGEAYDLELPFLTIDEQLRWVRTTGRAATREGRVVHIYGSIQDVTAAHEEREHLRHFHDLIELSEEGILETDAAGAVIYVNPRMAEMLGESTEDLLGHSITEALDPVDVAAVTRWLRDMGTSESQVGRSELRLRNADGHFFWVQAAARVTRNDDGGVSTVTTVVSDISEQKHREAELEEARRYLEEAQQLASIGHWRTDLVSGTVTWSRQVFTLFGRDPETFTPTASTFYEAIHPDDRERVLAAEQRGAIEGHHTVSHRIVRPDGSERVVQEVARTVCGDDGQVLLITGTVQDVTDVKRAELALETSERRLMRVLAATNDGWWDSDLTSGTAFHSDRWWEIYGYEPESLPSTPNLWRELVHPDDLPAIDDAFQQVLRARGSTFRLEGRVLHRQGHAVPVVVRGLIEYGDDGRPVRISGATTDVTEEKRAETITETFVSTVSHELRTPLTSIGGALELLDVGVGGELPPTARPLLEVAVRNTVRLRNLIDDLLDMEQLLAGQMSFALVEQPLEPVVRQSLLDDAPYADRYGVRFELTRAAGGISVKTDGNRVQQVLANYLSNAAKYAPSGSTIEVRLQTRGPVVRVGVIDGGPGVPESFAPRVFEKFAQADPIDERSRGGTGLGLAISRQIVQRLGGNVGFESEPGHTCFWFELPLADA